MYITRRHLSLLGLHIYTFSQYRNIYLSLYLYVRRMFVYIKMYV